MMICYRRLIRCQVKNIFLNKNPIPNDDDK